MVAPFAGILDPKMVEEPSRHAVVGGPTEIERREGGVAMLGKGFPESIPERGETDSSGVDQSAVDVEKEKFARTFHAGIRRSF